MIENFNPFISLGGNDEKINHMAEAALEMNLTCNDLKKDCFSSYRFTENEW